MKDILDKMEEHIAAIRNLQRNFDYHSRRLEHLMKTLNGVNVEKTNFNNEEVLNLNETNQLNEPKQPKQLKQPNKPKQPKQPKSTRCNSRRWFRHPFLALKQGNLSKANAPGSG